MDKTIPFAPQDALCDQWQGYYKEEYAHCPLMTSGLEECPEVDDSVYIVCANTVSPNWSRCYFDLR